LDDNVIVKRAGAAAKVDLKFSLNEKLPQND